MPLISNQPQYSMLWRVIEAEVVPDLRAGGLGQLVLSPIAQGVLTGKYQPGAAPPAGSRATDESGGADFIRRMLTDDVLTAGAAAEARSPTTAACRWRSWRWRGCCRTRTSRRRSSAPAGPSRSPKTSRPPAYGWTPAVLARIDEVLGDVVERDPARTGTRTGRAAVRRRPRPRPGWASAARPGEGGQSSAGE